MKPNQTTKDLVPVKRDDDDKDFPLPAWMDCAWKRVPCGQMNCPVCGHELRARAKHIARGEDPDGLEAALADITDNLSEVLTLLKKTAVRLDIKPPEPREFALYEIVREWCECVRDFLQISREQGAAWIITDYFSDLLWYTGTLQAKTYRQLTNAWERENFPELYGQTEHAYTRRVLGECCDIMNRALKDIMPLSGDRFVMISKCSSMLARLRARLMAL